MTFFENIFICPLCGAPLEENGKSLFCRGERRHCYDIASSGYVNLLPPGKASNARTGDDEKMLKARSRFLDTGYYDGISQGLASIAAENLSCRGNVTFIDAGCGEGYHTQNLGKHLKTKFDGVFAVGLDASKHGARLAAKRASREGAIDAAFAAGNIFSMPLRDKCADAVFSMFAPVPDAEALRVLKDDGILAVCSSGSKHLWELRQVLYGEPRISPPLDRVPDGFALAAHGRCAYTVNIEGRESIYSLFEMTPFFCHCPQEGRARLEQLESLNVQVETVYNIYKKANIV